MGIGSWGGGIVLGLVAVLWLVYLIPSWARRQQYLATERNAIRLQQTLRILAQTAEVPEEFQVEANAKSVATAQRILRTEEAKREAIRRAHEAARQRAITRELAATGPALRAADSDPALAARRLRRTRLATTLLLVLGLVAVVAGAVQIASAWPLMVAGTLATAGSLLVLGQLAQVSRARARRTIAAPGVSDAAPVAQPFQDFAPRQTVEAPAAESPIAAEREWTPVPLPRPLYMRRGAGRALARSSAVAGSPTTSADAEALREAAAEQVRQGQEAARLEAQREALLEVARAEAALQSHREPAAPAAPVVRAAPASAPAPVEPPAPASPFARMGYVDEEALEELRLDEVLRRRRAV
ncbi:DUF3040 domain-containing protein [Frondihabitans sp. PhB188]|uniref:DUF3040 domain-containing protein n=1 Tax=Frondihabitans sp. PhB188 TaxID=2485200 RepID=UPI000F48BCB7|nr:DUF3040 domain-containing protein [Frondihabitans sp. PhB188]